MNPFKMDKKFEYGHSVNLWPDLPQHNFLLLRASRTFGDFFLNCKMSFPSFLKYWSFKKSHLTLLDVLSIRTQIGHFNYQTRRQRPKAEEELECYKLIVMSEPYLNKKMFKYVEVNAKFTIRYFLVVSSLNIFKYDFCRANVLYTTKYYV